MARRAEQEADRSERIMAATAPTDSSRREDDTPLTDALLDQFAGYYVLAVLAVRALEHARRQHQPASKSG